MSVVLAEREPFLGGRAGLDDVDGPRRGPQILLGRALQILGRDLAELLFDFLSMLLISFSAHFTLINLGHIIVLHVQLGVALKKF